MLGRKTHVIWKHMSKLVEGWKVSPARRVVHEADVLDKINNADALQCDMKSKAADGVAEKASEFCVDNTGSVLNDPNRFLYKRSYMTLSLRAA